MIERRMTSSFFKYVNGMRKVCQVGVGPGTRLCGGKGFALMLFACQGDDAGRLREIPSLA